jgi:hypothetical protein
MTDTLSNYGVPFKLLLKRLLQNTMREWGYWYFYNSLYY